MELSWKAFSFTAARSVLISCRLCLHSRSLAVIMNPNFTWSPWLEPADKQNRQRWLSFEKTLCDFNFSHTHETQLKGLVMKIIWYCYPPRRWLRHGVPYNAGYLGVNDFLGYSSRVSIPLLESKIAHLSPSQRVLIFCTEKWIYSIN